MMAPSLQPTPEVNDRRVEVSCREETAGCHLELLLLSRCSTCWLPLLFDTMCRLQDFYNRDQRTSLTASFMHPKEQLSKSNSHLKDA